MRDAAGWALVHSIWEGAAIAAMLGALMLVVRAPRVRYAAGCVALVLIMLSFGITLIHFLPSASGTGRVLMKPVLPAWRVLPDDNGGGSDLGLEALIHC
jgi:hypothetical protein